MREHSLPPIERKAVGHSSDGVTNFAARKLAWAVGIPRHLKVYPADVQTTWPIAGRGRPRQPHIPDTLSIPAEDIVQFGAVVGPSNRWRSAPE